MKYVVPTSDITSGLLCRAQIQESSEIPTRTYDSCPITYIEYNIYTYMM